MKNKRTGEQVVISVVIVLACVALCLMTGTKRVSAATFTVTNTGDNGGVNPAPGAGTGTLRQAIIDANATAGADTINFQAGVTGTITLGSSLPAITESVMISGPGAGVVTVSGASTFQVFNIGVGVTASISGLTISNGFSNDGGGILNNGTLTLTDTVLSANSAPGTANGLGGGILNNGTLTINKSTLSGNSARLGGGIANNVGTLTITDSTLSTNSVNGTGASGGGVLNLGGTLRITNCTLSGNSAAGNSAGAGGGIANAPPGTANISFTTLSGNSADFGGGIINSGSFQVATLNIKNSIVANSTSGGDCENNAGTWNASGQNFTTNGTCPGFTQVTALQLNLGPLANNGGPTFTHALLPGSVAIDAVTDCTDLSAMPAPVNTDQRGLARPKDGDGNGSALCDAGAFELQPCVITCPANITQSNDPNQCGAVVTYSAPTTTGDCFTVTCSPPSGSFFAKGTTTVNCNASGTAATPDCTFTVTVNDTQAPTITCPANITQSTDPNQCSAVVSYKVPTPSDNCPGVTATCVPASGSTFLKGTTTVTCTATDSSNLTGTCTFTVTVNDTQAPTITCPANITVSTDPNLCSAVVNYPAPTVSDNCPGVGVPVCSPASGATFPKGTTTVTCTVADAAGNTGSCSFTVTVNDTQPPMITCPANVTAVAAQTCPISSTATVNFPPPTVSDNCPGVTSVCSPPSGSIFPVGTTTVTCTATDTSGNTATCSFTVTVFSGCLQDDSNPANVVLFNAATGEYRFCCGGAIFSGVGTVLVKGCIVTIQHYPADRRVLIKFDGSVGVGTASLQSPPGTIRCTITDRNTKNNNCACQ
jgi:hypothetical protein